MLKDQDKIKELFSEKLGNFQAPVNPELWSSIASQIGTTTAVVTTTSIIVKSIIGVAAASIVVVGTYLVLNSNEDSTAINSKEILVSANESKTNETLRSESITEIKHERDKEEISNSKKNVLIKDNIKSNSLTISSTEKEKTIETSIGVNVSKNDEKIFVPTPIKFITPEKTKEQPYTAGDKKDNSTVEKSGLPITEVKDKPSAEITNLPNVFTVSNNYGRLGLEIQYTGEFKDFNLVIMSRENQVVFKSNIPDFKWNGEMMNGETAPPGTYYYIITARDANGTAINKSQTLTIL